MVDGGACPNDLPADCPSPAPTYTDDVAAIIEARCWECHGPGGAEQARHDFSTYDSVYAQRGSMLTQVYSCRMPPAEAAPLASDERAALLSWLVCGAPE